MFVVNCFWSQLLLRQVANSDNINKNLETFRETLFAFYPINATCYQSGCCSVEFKPKICDLSKLRGPLGAGAVIWVNTNLPLTFFGIHVAISLLIL